MKPVILLDSSFFLLFRFSCRNVTLLINQTTNHLQTHIIFTLLGLFDFPRWAVGRILLILYENDLEVVKAAHGVSVWYHHH